MSGGWSIDPSGVGTILHSVMDQMGDGGGSALDCHLTTLTEEIANAAMASMSGPVGAELYGLLEHIGGLSEEMVERTGSAVEGCAQAVDAYLVGDAEMAAEAQSNAGTFEDPDL